MMNRVFLVMVITALVVACTPQSQHKPVRIVASPDQFTFALSEKYRLLAKSQSYSTHGDVKRWFEKKAARAAAGVAVDPEHPQDWQVRETVLQPLRNSRRHLLDIVDGEAMEEFPEESAEAFYLYDCWITQEANWRVIYRDICQKEFFNAINQISALKETMREVEDVVVVVEAEQPADSAQLRSQEAVKRVQEAVEASGIELPVVYFNQNSTVLTPKYTTELMQVVDLVAGIEGARVVLHGHAAESEEDSYELSRNRAMAVKDALVQFGLLEDQIFVFGFGAEDPDVGASINVADPNRKDRRVVVLVN